MSRPAFNHSDDVVGRCMHCGVAQFDADSIDCWKCDQPWRETDEVSDTESESE